MSKFKYLKISKSIKIRYLTNNFKRNPYVVFLHGFMSDLEGEKPKKLKKFCDKKKIGFLGLEYSGHGKSSGKFTNGNISKWNHQVKVVIKKIVKKNNFILIGSSMGSWIATKQFDYYKKQIKGFIGIGSAPEFLEKVMWKKFTKKMKKETIKNGVYYLEHGGFEYPITYQLIKDGRKNTVLNKKINTKIPIILFHGSKDEAVPAVYSKKLIRIFKSNQKKIFIIKGGDHSLFNLRYQKKIINELQNIVDQVN